MLQRCDTLLTFAKADFCVGLSAVGGAHISSTSVAGVPVCQLTRLQMSLPGREHGSDGVRRGPARAGIYIGRLEVGDRAQEERSGVQEIE